MYSRIIIARSSLIPINCVLLSVFVLSSQASFGPFGYNPPTITSVLPASGPTSGNLLITVGGDSFGTGATVRVAIGGIDWSASFVGFVLFFFKPD